MHQFQCCGSDAAAGIGRFAPPWQDSTVVIAGNRKAESDNFGFNPTGRESTQRFRTV